MKYGVLLRGVNVGGHRRVSKQDFQSVLESLGFYDVTVYINSGNAVFTTDQPVDENTVQSALESYFNFSVPTLLLPDAKIIEIAQTIPDDWTNDAPKPDKSGYKSDVLYLFDTVNSPDILEQIGYNPDIETMIYLDGAVLTTISRANQARGSLQKLIGTALYSQMTVRNIHTARKLAHLVGE